MEDEFESGGIESLEPCFLDMSFGEVNKTHFKGLDFSVDLTE